MNFVSDLASAFPAWARLAAVLVGAVSIPGCPRPQTPAAVAPDTDPNLAPLVITEGQLVLTVENRPVTIPEPEDETILLP